MTKVMTAWDNVQWDIWQDSRSEPSGHDVQMPAAYSTNSWADSVYRVWTPHFGHSLPLSIERFPFPFLLIII